MGRAAGQHAAGRGPLDPRARGGDGAVDLGGPFARPGVGAAVQRVRRRRARSSGLHARSPADRRQGPASCRGHRRSPPRVPRRSPDAIRRGRGGARRRCQLAALRRTDGHRPDPLGGRATARDLDRSSTRARSTGSTAGARAQISARLRAGHARCLRQVGGDRVCRRRCGVRNARRGAPRRADADR